MTRHGRSIHMVYSPQSWPTGRSVPVPMARAFSTPNVLSVTKKISAITPANTTLGLHRLINAAVLGGPPEDPIHKTP
jgi:hypothetical protein